MSETGPTYGNTGSSRDAATEYRMNRVFRVSSEHFGVEIKDAGAAGKAYGPRGQSTCNVGVRTSPHTRSLPVPFQYTTPPVSLSPLSQSLAGLSRRPPRPQAAEESPFSRGRGPQP